MNLSGFHCTYTREREQERERERVKWFIINIHNVVHKNNVHISLEMHAQTSGRDKERMGERERGRGSEREKTEETRLLTISNGRNGQNRQADGIAQLC